MIDEKISKKRIRKTNDQRFEEILDICEKLFYLKGYTGTTIAEIIKEAGIAKGTFYYYFKSKEDIMDAVIKRYVKSECDKIKDALSDDLRAIDKLRVLFETTQSNEDKNHKSRMINIVHRLDAELYVRSMAESINGIMPILVKIIEQGIQEGVFKIEHPLTTAQFILAGFQFLLNDGFYPTSEVEALKRFNEFIEICEDLLGSVRGSLSFFTETYTKCNA